MKLIEAGFNQVSNLKIISYTLVALSVRIGRVSRAGVTDPIFSTRRDTSFIIVAANNTYKVHYTFKLSFTLLTTKNLIY